VVVVAEQEGSFLFCSHSLYDQSNSRNLSDTTLSTLVHENLDLFALPRADTFIKAAINKGREREG
jgi:hypothetical protein